jgi:phospholipid/cholesterol/gamma-HCH transport system substrate-binding protein
MKRFDLELMVGIFFLIGIACLAYLSIKLGRMEVIGSRGNVVYAKFSNTGGLKNGAAVEIAGVEVGKIKDIELDPEDYTAVVTLLLRSGIKLPDDSIAAVKTKGLIGEKYVEITPGASERIIKPGGRIRETQPPFDLNTAISRLIFGKPGE